MTTNDLPDCPGCDAARTLEPIQGQPGWFVCSCCTWRVLIVNGHIIEVYAR